MTYGRDAQPDILFQGNNLKRGLHKAQGSVSAWTREVSMATFALRQNPEDKEYLEYLPEAQKTLMACQERVKAYRLLIAQRDMQRSILEAS